MKIADLSRHRRLLVLCACSAALHLALLEWFAWHGAGPFAAAPAPAGAELSVRLVPARAAAPPSAPSPPPAPAAPPVAAPAPAAPSAAAPPHTAPAARANAGPAPSTVPHAPQATPPPGPRAAAPATPVAAAAATNAPAEPGPPLVQMPGRYRVRLPAPALLAYDVVRQAANGPPAPVGTAHLDWHTDGDRYVLDIDGPLGRLHSEGASGDAGITPRRAREDTDAGPLVTDFDADGHRVLFRAAGTEAPDNVGIQDRASLLMQLAGAGLGDPDQIAGAAEAGVSVDVVVAGARDLRIARFRVLGREDVATGVGTLAAWHLAELAAPGVARLDVWLAPDRDWLPVRVRVDDGGASVTQTLAAIAPAPDLPAPAAH